MMKVKRLSIAFLGVIVVWLVVCQLSAYAAPESLAAVIDRNWSAWANNHESVNQKRLVDQLSNPGYTEENAAALAALAQQFKYSAGKQLTLDDVHKMIDRCSRYRGEGRQCRIG